MNTLDNKNLQMSGSENIWIIADSSGAFEIEFWSDHEVVRYPIELLPSIIDFLQKVQEEIVEDLNETLKEQQWPYK